MSKKKGEKMNLGAFLADQSLGSWADDVDTLPAAPTSGPTQFGSGRDSGRSDRPSAAGDRDRERDYTRQREPLPKKEVVFPTNPPYTAFVGNLHFETTDSDVRSFFKGLKVANVRLVRDKEEDRPKGFGYVEFEDLDSLKNAVTLSGEEFRGRSIRIDVTEPKEGAPRRQNSYREVQPSVTDGVSDWRKRETPFQPPPPPSSRNFGDDRGPRGSNSDRYQNDKRSSYTDRRGNRDDGFGDRRRPERPDDLRSPTSDSAPAKPEEPKKPKSNPFGNAKPRDENEIMKQMEERQKERAAAKAEEEEKRRQAAAAAAEEAERQQKAKEAKEAEAQKQDDNRSESGRSESDRNSFGGGRGGGSFRRGSGRGRGGDRQGDRDGQRDRRNFNNNTLAEVERSWRRDDNNTPPPPSAFRSRKDESNESNANKAGGRPAGRGDGGRGGKPPRAPAKPVAAPVVLEQPEEVKVANKFALLDMEDEE